MPFTLQRIAVETTEGQLVEERANPRASFAGHTLWTPWDLMQVAYFNGYARWTYLTTYPEGMVGHSVEQEFYFGPDLLLRRHDYQRYRAQK
jgi:hypothetical protein